MNTCQKILITWEYIYIIYYKWQDKKIQRRTRLKAPKTNWLFEPKWKLRQLNEHYIRNAWSQVRLWRFSKMIKLMFYVFLVKRILLYYNKVYLSCVLAVFQVRFQVYGRLNKRRFHFRFYDKNIFSTFIFQNQSFHK